MDLYLEYEKDMKLKEPLNLLRELELKPVSLNVPTPLTTQQIVQQMQQLAGAGIALGAVTEEQFVKIAVSMLPFVSGGSVPPASSKVALYSLPGATWSPLPALMSLRRIQIERSTAVVQGSPQEVIKQEVLWQRWEEK